MADSAANRLSAVESGAMVYMPGGWQSELSKHWARQQMAFAAVFVEHLGLTAPGETWTVADAGSTTTAVSWQVGV